MKTIGLIGGMSWKSSLEYYRIINEEVNKRLGGLHSARILMYSFDFVEINGTPNQRNWTESTKMMTEAAKKLENGGADCVVICTNTMHKIAEVVQENIHIPLLHIADATAERIKSRGLSKVGLLGTLFTLEEDFYKGRLHEKHALDVLIPDEQDRNFIQDVIFNELFKGQITLSSKNQFVTIVNKLAERGAEGVILGCTEIPLLIQQKDVSIPLFDTTQIHSEKAVEFSLQ